MFLELIDGRLTTPEEMRAFLEPHSPPAPPPQVTIKRPRAKRGEAKVKEAAFDDDEEAEDALDEDEDLDDLGGDEDEIDLGLKLPKVELDVEEPDLEPELVADLEEDEEEEELDEEDDSEPVAALPKRASKAAAPTKAQKEPPAKVSTAARVESRLSLRPKQKSPKLNR